MIGGYRPFSHRVLSGFWGFCWFWFLFFGIFSICWFNRLFLFYYLHLGNLLSIFWYAYAFYLSRWSSGSTLARLGGLGIQSGSMEYSILMYLSTCLLRTCTEIPSGPSHAPWVGTGTAKAKAETLFLICSCITCACTSRPQCPDSPDFRHTESIRLECGWNGRWVNKWISQ